ncbi:amino acid ABC transporter permease [Ruania albidiflava]|uniref:amino acid ABC transporter permease n=1 Tax=Ruania albidiflava TaxID=366586 RepID=UPI0003B7683B|nr:amino acid ABC transporter permease [Ruania albidiflava]
MDAHAMFDTAGPRAQRWIRIITVLSVLGILGLFALAYYRFYASGALAPSTWLTFTEPGTIRYLGTALKNTMLAAAAAGAMALPLGLLLALGRLSRKILPLRWLCTGIIELFRAIPVLLVIYVFMFALPAYGIETGTFTKLVVPITLCAAATLAEVFRAGVLALPRGQTEAGLSIGLTDGQTFRTIVLPQALRIVIPALVAQAVIVVKDTAFGYVVSYAELLQSGRVLIANTGDLVQTYLVVTIIYILVNVLISWAARALDRRMGRTGARRMSLAAPNRMGGIA